MAATGGRITVAGVDAMGADVTARRTAMGMSVSALAKKAGVDRGSLAALEEGRPVRDTTAAAVLRTLADLEHEMGMDVPESPQPAQSPHLIEFDLSDGSGVRLVIRAPVGDTGDVVDDIARLIREMKNDPPPPHP